MFWLRHRQWRRASSLGRMKQNLYPPRFLAGVLLLAAASRGEAAGYTESVLYDFCATGGIRCTDGVNPASDLVADKLAEPLGDDPIRRRARESNLP